MKKVLIKVLIVLTLLLLTGCATTEDFHKTIMVDKLRIHLVSDSSKFENPFFRGNPRCLGYAGSNEIWVVCSESNGKIKCPAWLIGHELLHELSNFYDSDVEDPKNPWGKD